MTSPIAKSGFILYYNVQCQTENDEDHWQNCTIEITEGNFLMWHSTLKDDDDSLQGSVQLGPGYEILTEKTGIPSDAPSVPKDSTLKQLFGIMMTELRLVYWFIDTTEELEWIKLMESYHSKERASSPLLEETISLDGISFGEKSPDTVTDKSSLTQLVKDNDSLPRAEQCQVPISTQPLPTVGFLPGNQAIQNNTYSPVAEATAHTDVLCIDMFCDFFYYICTFRSCCSSTKSDVSHLHNVDGLHHHTSHGDFDCCEGDSSCFCCGDCNDCSCECGDCNDCACECGDCNDCTCECGDCGDCNC